MKRELLACISVSMLSMCSVPHSVSTKDVEPTNELITSVRQEVQSVMKGDLAQSETDKKLAELDEKLRIEFSDMQQRLEDVQKLRRLEQEESARLSAQQEEKWEAQFAKLQKESKSTGAKNDLLVMGEVESVGIIGVKWHYLARIDTGATTCSIHAEKIIPFERDGEKWVRFYLVKNKGGEKVKLERKIERTVLIKENVAKPERRYVVKLNVSYGGARDILEFTLADRSKFEYPLLVGRNLLRGMAVVDVSKKNVQKKGDL